LTRAERQPDGPFFDEPPARHDAMPRLMLDADVLLFRDAAGDVIFRD